jgi:hypothetical protein
MALQLRTEILINAKPEKIWNVLMAFDDYPKWNPFIKSLSGNANVGNELVVELAPPNERSMTIKPKVTDVQVHKRFSWLGHLLFPGLFDGEHIFELIDNGNGTTTFVHRENFGGILIPLFNKMLKVSTKRGFEMMNEKLKELAEAS